MNTKLILREPDLYFESIHNELNNFLRDIFLHPSFAHPLNVKKNSVWRPVVEVKQNNTEYKIKVQLPGVNKDDIELELDNDFMTVKAVVEEEKEENSENELNQKFNSCEFRYGKYLRTISFDTPVKPDMATARYKNGVLKINIPKYDIENKKVKKVVIQ